MESFEIRVGGSPLELSLSHANHGEFPFTERFSVKDNIMRLRPSNDNN